jgi:hypothetical protein
MIIYSTELETKCKDFIQSYLITSNSKGEKSVNDLVHHLWPIFVKYQIDFDTFLTDYKEDKIIDVSFLDKAGIHKWHSFVNPKYLNVAKELFTYRPAGLGTPNAQCGEGEFMLFVLSPRCKKPKKGDVMVNGSVKEFKDDKPRVYSKNTTGNSFRLKTLELCYEYNLEPLADKNNRKSVELTECKTQSKTSKMKQMYWDLQLNKLSIDDRIQFVKKWLILTNAFSENDALKSAKRILINGTLNRTTLQTEICKYFFKKQLPDTPGDNILMFNNDLVVNIEYNFDTFSKLFDDKTLVPQSNYFRVFQNFPLAWYYTYNIK